MTLIEVGVTDGQLRPESPIPPHPMGIKPLGNQYLSSAANDRSAVGHFEPLPDELLAQLLEYLGHQSLRRLAYTCRFLFVFCHSDDLWKTLFLESHEKNKRPFQWKGTWRSSLLGLAPDQEAKIDCRNVFSDVLYRPFVCRNSSLSQFLSTIPKANEIKRFEDMTCEEFGYKWSGKPFILTDCIRAWPACEKWKIQQLLSRYADVVFRAEAVDWPFSTYCDYMQSNGDESPLYLFDKKFAEKMRITSGKHQGADYWNPDCFGPDLFEVLGSERPAHRWLIIGPARSGSTFHKDPNGTSAWNAVLEGAKYWIMFPPRANVPGVYVSADQSEVTSPLTIAEWLLEFQEAARKSAGCVEGICRAGEILHVPSGWWHLVVNLESGVALTQNFVPTSHLTDVLSFLRDKPDQVSGFKRDVANPYGLFVDRLRAQCPRLVDEALADLARRRDGRKRKWEELIAVGETDHPQGSGGFRFGFGLADEDEDETRAV